MPENATIQLFNLTRLHRSIESEIAEAMDAVVSQSAFIGGQAVRDFESAFAQYQGTSHAVGCGSGTDALALALRGLGVGPGDEVIVPAMTFVATAEAVLHVGATPVLVDIDPNTLLIDPEKVQAAIGPRTAAVMPVHLYGHCVSHQAISGWRQAGLAVVEDAAQAHGASYPDHLSLRSGGAGNAACFSFYPGKNLGAYGDGGAVATNSADLANQVRVLTNHGRQGKFDHDQLGWCSRLDTIQAAVLAAKLSHLDTWNKQRVAVAEYYQRELASIEHVSPIDYLPGAVYHQFIMRVHGDREQLRDHLEQQGIKAGIHYPRAVSEYSAYTQYSTGTPVAEDAAATILSLPMDPLLNDSELSRIIGGVTSWLP